MSWQNGLLVALGGALGSVLRYAVTLLAAARFGPQLPWGTFAVNLAGSFVIGIVAELATGPIQISPAARIFLATGLCGGFTTFSSFGLDTLVLTRDGLPVAAAAYVCGSVVLGLVCVYLGIVAARAVTPHG